MVAIMDIYKTLDIIIGTVTKNPEMIKFGPDHFKTNKGVSMPSKNYLI